MNVSSSVLSCGMSPHHNRSFIFFLFYITVKQLETLLFWCRPEGNTSTPSPVGRYRALGPHHPLVPGRPEPKLTPPPKSRVRPLPRRQAPKREVWARGLPARGLAPSKRRVPPSPAASALTKMASGPAARAPLRAAPGPARLPLRGLPRLPQIGASPAFAVARCGCTPSPPPLEHREGEDFHRAKMSAVRWKGAGGGGSPGRVFSEFPPLCNSIRLLIAVALGLALALEPPENAVLRRGGTGQPLGFVPGRGERTEPELPGD